MAHQNGTAFGCSAAGLTLRPAQRRGIDLARHELWAISSAMTEQNQVSSDLPSIDPGVVSWVEYWHPIAWKGLLIACSLAVLAAVASIAFLLLLWRTSTVRHQTTDWHSTALQAVKAADADLLRAKKDVADAHAEAAEAQTKAIHASETALALKASAAEVQQRIAALEKEHAVANAALAAADARAASAQEEATRATESIARLQADLASAPERIATLEQQASAAKAALADTGSRLVESEVKARRAAETISALEAEAAKAQSHIATLEKEAATAKAGLADANARAIQAQADATRAQKRMTTLENEADSEAATRAESDRLAAGAQKAPEKTKAPRSLSLEQQARITAALRPYAGQEYTLSVGSDSESENLLCQIDAALRAAKWKSIPSPYSITIDTKCGVYNLNSLWGFRIRLSDKANTKHQWNMLMLVNALKAEGIATDGSIETDETSPTAIAVGVGVQPK
jgi:hypothetical protein